MKQISMNYYFQIKPILQYLIKLFTRKTIINYVFVVKPSLIIYI